MTVTIQNPSPTMRDLRDIRTDLRERIAALEALAKDEADTFQKSQEKAIALHKRQMDAFHQALESYRKMLSLEETLADNNIIGTNNKVGPMPTEIKIPVSRLPLPEFFITEIKGKALMTKEELRLAAFFAGYFAEGESGGRATHATLMNLLKNKRLLVDFEGRYSVNLSAEASMF